MLEVKNINVAYGRIQVLWDVSLKVNQGEIVAIIGAITLLAFTLGHGSLAHLTQSTIDFGTAGSSSVFLMIIMAMAGAFWAYDGWINVPTCPARSRTSRQ
jgi:predicted ABC-type transport system involved in lysophospholipase L1 biosynthesis ATPase subunit